MNLYTVTYALRHPRNALCDAGIWKCGQHNRMMWLASDRRWAIRHRLRARRVRSWAGWTPAELDAMLTPVRAERAAVEARLAGAMHGLILAKHRAAMARVHAHVDALGLAPWQRDMLILSLDARMMGLDVGIEVPR